MSSQQEENYLKAIYKLTEKNNRLAGNVSIAQALNVNPATVSDMLKRLHDKKYIVYQKQKGASLTIEGRKVAIKIIRKHRLWEVFLVEKMKFAWDEVHEVAEQLEHIQSEKLIGCLDEMLGYPKTCPHGDPIPDKKGNIQQQHSILLSEGGVGKNYIVKGFTDTSDDFLRYLNKTGIAINDKLKIERIEKFDDTYTVLAGKKRLVLSNKVAALIKVMV